MNLPIRRSAVLLGIAVAVFVGYASIRIGAGLTAAAAPPPAPPISMSQLLADLRAEQARSAALQAQLDELDSLTTQLSDAIDSTQGDIAADGLTAKELRARLKAAQQKLTTMTALLRDAQKRLAAVNAAAAGSAGSGSRPAGGTTSQPAAPPAAPTPIPTRTPRPTETPEWHGTPEPQH